MKEKIRLLIEQNNYSRAGQLFLTETGTTLEVVEAVPQKKSPWIKEEGGAQGTHYACKIKNARGNYSFDFWGSIANAEILERAKTAEYNSPEMRSVYAYLTKSGQGVGLKRVHRERLVSAVGETIKPTAYDILACLHDDAGESFEDFCVNYGYDTDSIRAERTYRAVVEQERNVRKLFTHEQLEALAEIV